MDDRELDLTESQKETKSKYPAINKKYEYLDHTADVQLHSWGDSLEEAFEQCAMAMFGYMTDTETVEPIDTVEVESEGDDMESLLFHFLDDWLFKFSADLFFIPRVRAFNVFIPVRLHGARSLSPTPINRCIDFLVPEVKVLHIDRMHFKIRSIGWGEEFNLVKHPQGTEVKAITYSAMQIHDIDKPEIFAIIDI
ncbi:protein archease isoform X1 [Oncorhynchus kisutch]|uniref:protein archease isoform X1 n=1 Tax=Oncorhynchus kisutch TaxID=8019 RepID=UPI0012DCE04C|nr:protein archease isoform X1 [Oncorhynchus kisutch]